MIKVALLNYRQASAVALGTAVGQENTQLSVPAEGRRSWGMYSPHPSAPAEGAPGALTPWHFRPPHAARKKAVSWRAIGVSRSQQSAGTNQTVRGGSRGAPPPGLLRNGTVYLVPICFSVEGYPESQKQGKWKKGWERDFLLFFQN